MLAAGANRGISTIPSSASHLIAPKTASEPITLRQPSQTIKII